MAQEALREAVRAAYLRGFNSVPSIAVILPDGTPAAHWAGLDAAIATMFERLRDLPPSIYDGPDQYVRKADVLAAFQQENSDAD